MVRERRGKKSKSKDVEEAPPAPALLEVPAEPAINRFFKREKSPFEVGDKKELQVASSNAIIDKACVMDISGGAAQVAAKVDEYINLLFTDYCALDQASCGDISKEIKIVVIEEEGELASIQPALSVEEEEKQRQEAEEAARKAAEEEAKRRAQEEQRAREEAERLAREEEERIAQEEAERIAAEEAEKLRIEEEKKKAAEEEKRKKAEAEAKKKAEEEEKAKKEAEEKARLEAEAEAARKKAEEEAYDSDRELIPPKEDDGIDWEAVEEEAPLVPDVLQELLEQRATEEEGEPAEESEKEMTERDRDLEWQRQRQMMRPPLVISHLKSRAVPIGSTAKLTCNVTGPSLSVRWLKNGNPVELKPEKYKFFNSEGLLSLEILNVSKRDAGEYTCFAKNKNGETSTIASVTVYDTDVERPIPPTFITIKESYNLYNDLLTLECRVRGTPKPHIQWMKDGDYIMPGDKYQQTELPDGTCKLIIHSPDPEEDSGTYTCEAECNGCSDSISHNVQYEGSVENQFNRVHRYYHRDPLKPYFKTGLVDTNVPSGGSIALFVESQANCEAEWYRDRWVVDHKPPKRYIFNDGNGFFACVINHATMDEAAKYSCKLSNPYGTSQSTSFIDVINPNQVGKGQKPPIFLTRPQPEIKIRAGDPFSMSFRVQGEPKPRIQWYKGARDITNAGRTIKEVFNDYVRFSIKESKENDSGIYFITARNRHGVDRSFCQVTVKQARTGKKDEKKIEDKVEENVETVDRSEKGRN